MSKPARPQHGDKPVVRLLTTEGKIVACDVHRDPGLDRPPSDPRGQMCYWRAVPREPVALGTYEVEAVTCPPHMGFWVDVPQAGPMLASLPPEMLT